jgi:uncharacterized protein
LFSYTYTMLLVKTELKPSPISGIGLYAAEFIPKGTLIWKFVPQIDIRLDLQEYERLKKTYDFSTVDKYIYKSKLTNTYILCGDDGRFINHSSNPNTIDTQENAEGLTIASRDIQAGEEITSDYAAFDADYHTYSHILN